MKAEHRELATALVNLTEHHLGDHYRSLNDALNSSLASSAMFTSPEEAIANKAMLDAVSEQLPAFDYAGERVHAKDPAQVRWLQSSLVWRQRKEDYSDAPPLPAYLVGIATRGASVDLLLHATPLPIDEPRALSDPAPPDALYIARNIQRKQFKEAETFMGRTLTSPLSEDALSKALDKDGNYGVHQNTFASILLTNRGWRENRRLQRANGGVALHVQGGYEELRAVSNETLATFNVFDRLAYLAVGFGKTAEINEIIESSASED